VISTRAAHVRAAWPRWGSTGHSLGPGARSLAGTAIDDGGRQREGGQRRPTRDVWTEEHRAGRQDRQNFHREHGRRGHGPAPVHDRPDRPPSTSRGPRMALSRRAPGGKIVVISEWSGPGGEPPEARAGPLQRSLERGTSKHRVSRQRPPATRQKREDDKGRTILWMKMRRRPRRACSGARARRDPAAREGDGVSGDTTAPPRWPRRKNPRSQRSIDGKKKKKKKSAIFTMVKSSTTINGRHQD